MTEFIIFFAVNTKYPDLVGKIPRRGWKKSQLGEKLFFCESCCSCVQFLGQREAPAPYLCEPNSSIQKSITSSVKSCPYETLSSFTNTEWIIMENALLTESNDNDADHCIGHKEGGYEEFVGTVLARSSVLTIPRRWALFNIFLNVYILGLSLSGLRSCPDYP